jgi:hypothetical protein
MDFSFGIPSQRGKTAATSNFCTGTPALVILKNAGPRTSKVMILNTEACEQLEIEDKGQIAFDFTKTSPVLVNATDLELPKGQGHIVRTKKEYGGLAFKDSKLWAYFVKTYNLDETVNTNFIFGDEVSTQPVAVSISLEVFEESSVKLDVMQIIDEVSISNNGKDTTEEVSNSNNSNY